MKNIKTNKKIEKGKDSFEKTVNDKLENSDKNIISSIIQNLNKKEIIKEDGRYLIYYEFEK